MNKIAQINDFEGSTTASSGNLFQENNTSSTNEKVRGDEFSWKYQKNQCEGYDINGDSLQSENDDEVYSNLPESSSWQEEHIEAVKIQLHDEKSISSQIIDYLSSETYSKDRLSKRLDELNNMLKEKYCLNSDFIRLERLGSGVFGEVHRVFDSRNRRYYALKQCLNTEPEPKKFDTLAINEIKSALSLIKINDSRLLQIYQINYKPGESLSILMDYGHGTLHDLLCFLRKYLIFYENLYEDIHCNLEEQLEILQQNSFCHRDIKPENIIIRYDKFVLCDYGLAQSFRNKMQVTPIAGTLEYLPPEIRDAYLQGQKAYPMDLAEVDNYALKKTFGIIKKTLDNCNLRVSKEEFNLKFQADVLLKIYCSISHEEKKKLLENLSGSYLLDELKKLLENEIHRLDNQGTGNDSQSLLNEYNLRKSLGYINQLGGLYDKALEHYYSALELLEKKQDLNEPIFEDEEIASIYLAMANAFKSQGKNKKALEYKFLTQDILTKQQSHKDELLANAYLSFANLYKCIGQYEKALNYLNEGENRIKKCTSISKDQSVLLQAGVYFIYGSILYHQGKYIEAIKYHEKSIEMRVSLSKYANIETDPNLAKSFINIGLIYQEMGKYKEALNYYNKSLEILKALTSHNIDKRPHPDLSFVYSKIGVIQDIQGRFDDALKFHYLSLEKMDKSEDFHPDMAVAYMNLGNVLKNLVRNEEALENYFNSLEMFEKIYPHAHPSIASCYNNIANVYSAQGKYTEALEFYKKSLEIKLELYGNSGEQLHLDIAQSYTNIATVYNCQGEYEKALEYHQKSLEISLEIYQDPHPYIAVAYMNLGVTYYNQEEYDRSLEYLRNSLEMLQKIYPDQSHPLIGSIYVNIGLVLESQGESLEALSYFMDGLKLFLLKYPHGIHSGIAYSYMGMGCSYRSLGKYEKAYKYLQKSLDIREQLYKTRPHLDIALSHYHIGLLYEVKMAYMLSLGSFKKALKVYINMNLYEHPHKRKVEDAIHRVNERLGQES